MQRWVRPPSLWQLLRRTRYVRLPPIPNQSNTIHKRHSADRCLVGSANHLHGGYAAKAESLCRQIAGAAGGSPVAAKRLGFSGVTTMKMISTTNKTSISGVTFMNGVGLVWVWRQADIASSPQELPQTWRSDPALHSVCIGFLDTL